MSGYVATFSRTYALDHEDVELLSFGHPLVEDALEWARESFDNSAALAVVRGLDKEGAVFLWRFGLEVPDEAADVLTYFEAAPLTLALDESGARQPDLDDLLDDPDIDLARMDAKPLRQSVDRWRALIENNYVQAKAFTEQALKDVVGSAEDRMTGVLAIQEREQQRHHAREMVRLKQALEGSPGFEELVSALEAEQAEELEAFAVERSRSLRGVQNACYSLQAAVAVRLVKDRHVSA